MRRVPIDHDDVRKRVEDVCFICEIVTNNPHHAHRVIYEDADNIAFLNRYPTLYGYVLVAPKAHKEQVTGDFTEDEYVTLQRVIHRIGEAIRSVVDTERLYVLSLGSQAANRHVHWHLAPLPPGVPFKNQQYKALDRDDYVQLTSAEAERLAKEVRGAIDT
jgi:diadenosine tetraphosphate (Ap4A) HIT family hydrolase